MTEWNEDTRNRLKPLGELLRREGQAAHADDIAAALAELDRLKEREIAMKEQYGGYLDRAEKAEAELDRRAERIAQLEAQFESAKNGVSRNAEKAAGYYERVEELEKAVRWALGECGEFKTWPDAAGAYWWRTELRLRANLPFSRVESKQ